MIDITPAPVLSTLGRAHHWVVGLNEMPGRVLILGGVAAADLSADETHSEVDPGVARLEAFFTAAGVGLNFLNLVEVGTYGSHTARMLQQSGRSDRDWRQAPILGAERLYFSSGRTEVLAEGVADELGDHSSAFFGVADGHFRSRINVELEATYHSLRGFRAGVFGYLEGLGRARVSS